MLYKLFKGLTTPATQGEKVFEELKRLMTEHQNPRPKLNLTEHIGYGEVLNDMLRD